MQRHAATVATQRPLDRALEEEIGRLELLICRVWQLMWAIGVVGGVLIYFVLDLPMAGWCSLVSAVLLAWSSLEAQLRQRHQALRLIRVVNTVIEGTMPWFFMLLITLTQGAAYALSSWIPPMLFCSLVVASTARLRPETPLFIAVSGALTFPVTYFAFVQPELTEADLQEPLFGPSLQVSRAVSLLLGGMLASLVARGLRDAIGRADVTARERDLFGKYRLERRVASGGMGTVHEATYCPEGGFERRVAVKIIHPHLASMERFVSAFRSEAQLSARLAHPNIVQVLDFGRVGESYFLAMEFVEGMTLASLMRRLWAANIDIPTRLVAFIAQEILSGLHYSHAGARDGDGNLLRVVHRDLSPVNVLVSCNGEVKITDFGVARALHDTETALSQSVVGHAGYMAPEQARAHEVDERSDIFSLGAIVWELLAGEPLFRRDTQSATLMALVSVDVPPVSSRRTLETGWDDVVARALQKERHERFPSALAMSRALAAIQDVRLSVPTLSPADELAELVHRALELPDEEREEATVQRPLRDGPTARMGDAGAR